MAASAARVLNTVCAFQRLRVETTDGRRLGRVFDLHCRWPKGTGEPPVIEAIICGRIGLLERVGLVDHDPDAVPWSAVREIRGRVIVVDAAAIPARPKR